MSDADDLGGFNPTTPVAPSRAARLKQNGTTTTAAAGPSTKPTTKKPRGIKRARVSPDLQEVEMIDLDTQGDNSVDDDDVVLQRSPPPQPAKKAGGKRAPPSRILNGNGKSKGKAKQDRPAIPRMVATARKPNPPAVAEVHEIEDEEEEEAPEEEEDEDEDDMKTGAGALARAINAATKPKNKRLRAQPAGYQAELDRLKEQNEELQSQIQILQKQLEEVFQIRQTEPELLLEQQTEHWEARAEAQAQVIQGLTTLLEAKEPLMRPGKTSIMNLITREAADEEKRVVEKELKKWRELAEARQATLSERENKMSELEAIEKELRYELKLEIERSSTLAKASKNVPGSAQRGRAVRGVPIVDDAKHGQLVRFYEDLTNLLVTNLKYNMERDEGPEEWVFSCIYSYAQENVTTDYIKDLHFTLTIPVKPTDDQAVPDARYVPQNLDKEKPELREKLEFLGDTFTFSRHQMPVFLRTLYDNVSATAQEDLKSESDGEPALEYA